MGAMAGTAERDLGSIVESAAEGDEVAFGRIVAAYQEQMYCICVVVCRDRTLAEEAVQSAWSKVWQRLGSLPSCGSDRAHSRSASGRAATSCGSNDG